MYEYINGNIALLTPAYTVIDVQGIGYYVNISLQTYSQLAGLPAAKLYVNQVVREDANLLYGFFDEEERHIFRMLITVNGVGPNTAMMMLSSLSAEEIRVSILKEDINTLKSVKGIGLKTAQRIVVDLRDKVATSGATSDLLYKTANKCAEKEEALAALVALGFAKSAAEKTLDKLLKQTEKNYTVEELIKASLKQM
ncbi:MAG: Holliday junction branch migration protein RuvA [Prevotellaceae bacterium]|jgi:Holliday junction DNA helicase RuvA|nr:Holliday junction branch migration protein RuvA [Prevotellaceae bacterium]